MSEAEERIQQAMYDKDDIPEEGADERRMAEEVLDGQVSTEAMLTNREVANLAGVVTTSVGNWTSAGLLSFETQDVKYPDGRTRKVRMFKKSEVDEFLRKRQAGEVMGLTSSHRRPSTTKSTRLPRKLRGLGIDALIENMEREIIALKRLRETERRDIEQEVKARLVASIQRNH